MIFSQKELEVKRTINPFIASLIHFFFGKEPLRIFIFFPKAAFCSPPQKQVPQKYNNLNLLTYVIDNAKSDSACYDIENKKTTNGNN